MSKAPLRLGLAGLGTVGGGVVRIVQSRAATLEARCGRPVEIAAVSARSRGRDRGVDLSAYAWEDDPVALAQRDDVDVFVEMMGGEDGPAKAAVEAAIESGKHVVTANKAMLAHHGQAMAEAAEAAGVALRYEAAVAGGIPIVRALAEGLAGDRATRVMGVMNGTCNYILTEMERTGADYADVLAEAQLKGYAEADPTFDVGGVDAAHKLALLASVAFGTRVDFGGVAIEGVERISLADIRASADMGFRIKLLGVARMVADGLERRRQDTTTGTPDAQLVLDGVRVGPDALLGPADPAGTSLRWLVEHATVAACAVMSGVAAEAVRITGEYTTGREQFGRPIATFQAVGQRAADAYVDAQAIRLTMLQAAWRLAAGVPADREVAVAKYWASLGGQRVVHAAAHLHGGMGVDRDYPLHRYFLLAKQLELLFGGASRQLLALGGVLAAEGPSR